MNEGETEQAPGKGQRVNGHKSILIWIKVWNYLWIAMTDGPGYFTSKDLFGVMELQFVYF